MMCARLFTKGAAEIILDLCTQRVRDDSGVTKLSQEEKDELLHNFSKDGNRCALVAQIVCHSDCGIFSDVHASKRDC